MKNFLAAFILLSFAANAQEAAPPLPLSKVELGISHGWAWKTNFMTDASAPEHTVSIFRNFRNFQAGIGLQFGIGEVVYKLNGRFIAPTLVANKLMRFNKFYLYGGGRAGYIDSRNAGYITNTGRSEGYTVGLQSGVVWHGEHFGFNAELGVRSEQLWTTVTQEIGYAPSTYRYSYRDNYFNLYFPLSLGVRYMF